MFMLKPFSDGFCAKSLNLRIKNNISRIVVLFNENKQGDGADLLQSPPFPCLISPLRLYIGKDAMEMS